jgi:nucleoside-diphosphate-sugar epimerase
VRRFVHLSTIDVYDTAGVEQVTEQTPYRQADPADREYEQQKLAAEKLVLAANGDDLETVVLQPGVVYGPWGGQWTSAQLTRPPGDYDLLPAGQTGACNAVYVDDVADAAVQAIGTQDIAGECFLIGNAEPVAWGQFFDAFRGMLDLGAPTGASSDPVAEWELELYRSPARAQFDKSTRLLGFTAKTSFADGMAVTEQWAQWFGQVPVSLSAGAS